MTTQSLDSFISSTGLSMTAKPAAHNPNADFPDGSSHWSCTLHCGRSRMTVPFSMGSAHTQPPQIADVLDCLASDAAGLENARQFEEWCSDYGYDSDSRKAEKTFRAVVRQSDRLHAFLGDSAYETLLWNTERQ